MSKSEKLIRTIHPEVRIVDASKGIVDYVASDETIDSYREVIRANGWRFDMFKKNAPFLDSHNYDTIKNLLGRVIDFEIKGGRLIERVQWAIDVPDNELARIGFRMTEAGYLKAVSVGFWPIKYLTPTDAGFREQLADLKLPADAPVRTIYTESQQVELSACVIGANSNALARSAGVINDEEFEKLETIRRRRAETEKALKDSGDALARSMERGIEMTEEFTGRMAELTAARAASRAHATRAKERKRAEIVRSLNQEGRLSLNRTEHTNIMVKEQKDFETTVLDGIEGIETKQGAMETKQETLIKNYDQLDKETKKAFEELTKVKNAMNDVVGTVKSLEKVQLALRRETRMAYGDPIQRLLANEESCLRINALLRSIAMAAGDKMPTAFAERFKAITGKALGEDSSPGSTMIDDVLAKEIYDTLAHYGRWNTLGVRRLGTKQTKFPVKTARPIANVILTEAGTVADDTNKAGTSVTLEVEVIAVLLNVALQLLQDSEYDVTADVMNDFVEAYNYRLDYLAFASDGTSDATNGAMTGLFNYGTAAVAAAGNILVEGLQLDDIVRCLTTVDSVVISRPSKWWMHPQILARMILIRDRNGRSIFLTANEAPTQGGIGSILGYPVIPVEAAPSTNAANQKVAAFGDPDSLVVGIRTDFVFEASDQFRWNTLERSFRAYGRAGVKGRRAQGSAILKTAAA